MPFMAQYDPFSADFDNPLRNSSPDVGWGNRSYGLRPIGDLTARLPESTFRERNRALRNLDNDRNTLIEDLIHELESTQNELKKLKIDQARDSSYTRQRQLREAALVEQLRRMKDVIASDPYIRVLINGDDTLFTKELLAKGERGGKDAAENLFTAISSYVEENMPHLSSPRINVRIYANTRTLTDKLITSKTIDRSTLLEDFIGGFNGTNASFDFIDAGFRKNASMNKITEYLQSDLRNCQCHQVILGVSQDEQRLELTDQVLNSTLLPQDRLTLLETIPFADRQADSEGALPIVRFDGVFQTKLDPPSPRKPLRSISGLPPLVRIETSSTNGIRTPPTSTTNTPVMTWASLTAQPPPVSTRPSTGISTPSSTDIPTFAKSKPAPTAIIERNRSGQRIDKVDITIPNQEIQRIKKLKLCNVYYLQGTSLCTSSNCSHSHSYPLTQAERKALREVARMTPCHYKIDCDDPECIYGHRCPQSKPGEKECYYGHDCRFRGWGHGIDTRVVKTVKV